MRNVAIFPSWGATRAVGLRLLVGAALLPWQAVSVSKAAPTGNPSHIARVAPQLGKMAAFRIGPLPCAPGIFSAS